MIVIGLSGGIASGKNFICDIFERYGAKVFDADNVVNYLMENDQQIINKISEKFEDCLIDEKINKSTLSNLIFNSGDETEYSKNIKILEDIIHPKIRVEYDNFLKKCKLANSKIVILNIPLLREKDYYKYDKLISISCDVEIRKKRFLKRLKQKNNEIVIENAIKRFNLICSRQLNDNERLKNADFVIVNNKSMFYTITDTKKIILNLLT